MVLTGSYAEQDVASINPRFDRDRAVMPTDAVDSAEEFPFLRTQFLDQPLRAWDYETKNFTGSIEFEPMDGLKFYADATVNQQERIQQSSRAFFSGTGANPVISNTNNVTFENVNLGSVDGEFGTLDLGEVTVVRSGIIGVGTSDGGTQDPNLRVGSNTGSRITDSNVFAIGSEWTQEKLQLKAEISYSDSKTELPGLNTDLDFLREYDLVGRYGGDEFVIAFSSFQNSAMEIFERIRMTIAGLQFNCNETQTGDISHFSLTTSMGVSSFSHANLATLSLDEMLKTADKTRSNSSQLGSGRIML
mgnify:CR=1 FL=1